MKTNAVRTLIIANVAVYVCQHLSQGLVDVLFGLWPAGVFPAANGLTGALPPFLRFLSAFGFFFSLLLRI